MPSSTPTPLGVAHAPLRDQVRDEIRLRIIDGRLAPGTRIVERDIAAELAVSRVPVREALRMLQTEGFVSVVPRKGVVVRSLSRVDVVELFDVREALEVLATRRAAETATTARLRRLGQLLAKARKAIDAGDPAAAAAANDAFHDEIILLAGNELLASLLEPLQGRLHWLFRQIADLDALWSEHKDLYDAIASGDPDRAAGQALRHVRANREVALEMLFDDDGQSADAVRG
jgi:DNA-binding GntR family transcriptional regulator